MANSPIEICNAKRHDAAPLNEVYRDAWTYAYRGIIPHRALEAMVAKRSAKWWQSAISAGEPPLLIRFRGQIAGYATFGASRSVPSFEGEIYELYLAPQFHGVGLGEYLFEGARQRLDAQGRDGLIIWVLDENATACDFYYRRGGRVIGHGCQNFFGVRLEKTAFGWN